MNAPIQNPIEQYDLKPLNFALDQAHSVLGASSMGRWSQCTISPYFESLYEDSSGTHAELGTLWHTYIEQVLTHYVNGAHYVNGKHYVNGTGTDASINSLTGVIEAWCEVNEMPYKGPGPADECVDYCISVYERLKKIDDRTVMLMEQHVVFEGLADNPTRLGSATTGLFGTADIIIIGAGEYHVIDYKNGYTLVGEEHNTQLQYYALAGIFTHAVSDYLMPQMADTLNIRMFLTIVQPNAGERIPSVRTWEPDLMEVMSFFHEVLVPTIEKIKAGRVVFREGKHCRFCKHILRCEQQNDIIDQAKERGGEVRLKKTGAKKEDRVDDPLALTPTEMGEALDSLQAIKLYEKELKSQAQELIYKGTQIPGYKVVHVGVRTKNWTDERKAKTTFNKICKSTKGAVKPSDLMQMLSPAAALKLVSDYETEVLEDLVSIPDPTKIKLIQEKSRSDVVPFDEYKNKKFGDW